MSGRPVDRPDELDPASGGLAIHCPARRRTHPERDMAEDTDFLGVNCRAFLVFSVTHTLLFIASSLSHSRKIVTNILWLACDIYGLSDQSRRNCVLVFGPPEHSRRRKKTADERR